MLPKLRPSDEKFCRNCHYPRLDAEPGSRCSECGLTEKQARLVAHRRIGNRLLIIFVFTVLVAMSYAALAGVGVICFLVPFGTGMSGMVALTIATSGRWSRAPAIATSLGAYLLISTGSMVWFAIEWKWNIGGIATSSSTAAVAWLVMPVYAMFEGGVVGVVVGAVVHLVTRSRRASSSTP